MFERFTDGARRVVVHAQEERRLLGHDRIGAKHLLLGLARDDFGPGGAVLGSLGLTLTGLRDAVVAAVGDGGPPPLAHIPFTPRAKRVLETSLREALRLRHRFIGSGHLLLALLAEDDGVAAEILGRAGSAEEIRARTVEAIAATPEPEPTPQAPSPPPAAVARTNKAARTIHLALNEVQSAKNAAIDAGDLAGAQAARDREKALIAERLRLVANLMADDASPSPPAAPPPEPGE